MFQVSLQKQLLLRDNNDHFRNLKDSLKEKVENKLSQFEDPFQTLSAYDTFIVVLLLLKKMEM